MTTRISTNRRFGCNRRLIAVTAILLLGTPAAISQERPDVDILGLWIQLQSPDESIRLAAAKSLGNVGPAAKETLPRLKEVSSKDSDAHVRRVAASAVSRIEQSLVVAQLITDLKSADDALRLRAAKRLGKLGAAAKLAAALLETIASSDPDDDVRVVAQDSVQLIDAALNDKQHGERKIATARTQKETP